MLTLPIKKKWFDMILSGEKKVEYREVKRYWIKRICNQLGIRTNGAFVDMWRHFAQGEITADTIDVLFRNGYGNDKPYFIAKCQVGIGKGNEEWGAEKGKEYFLLIIKEIVEGSGNHAERID